jgi:hypothetical protein
MPLGRAPLSGHPSHLAVGRWPLAVGPLRGPLAAPPPPPVGDSGAAVGGSAGGWQPRPAVGGERLCSMFHVPPLILRGVGGCKKNLKSLSRKKKFIGAGALKPAPNLEHGTRDTTVDATALHAWRSRSESRACQTQLDSATSARAVHPERALCNQSPRGSIGATRETRSHGGVSIGSTRLWQM